MNIDGTMVVPGTNPVYYFDSTINNGDGTFGNWATLFHADALTNAGLIYDEVSSLKPYPTNWDGNPASLTGEAALLRPFIATDGDDWSISLLMEETQIYRHVVLLIHQIQTAQYDVR